jgi:large subunit ribosomal protein L3
MKILGKKVGMSQVFDKNGVALPITVVKAGPCIVTQIKTQEIDGYSSIQLGYLPVNKKSVTKPYSGHFIRNKLLPTRILKEFRTVRSEEFVLGQILTIDSFINTTSVRVTARSIGRGFSGCQKRHHFTRGPMTHGSKNHRRPGSIGQGSTPGRVFPGKKMAGRSLNKSVTIKNLKVVHIDSENNILIIKGAIPGKVGGLLSIQSDD